MVNRACGLLNRRKEREKMSGSAAYQVPKRYGSIFTSMLLVKVVWGKISGHTCRASVSSSPLLTDPFRWNTIGGWNVYQTLVCIPRLGSPILPFPFVEFPTDPGISTSTSLRYLQAVLSFFQNARCITVGRSSPARSRVGAPLDP